MRIEGDETWTLLAFTSNPRLLSVPSPHARSSTEEATDCATASGPVTSRQGAVGQLVL